MQFLCVASISILISYDVFFIIHVQSGRSHVEYISNVQLINEYLSYLLIAITIAFAAFRDTLLTGEKTDPTVLFFSVSMIAICASLLFIPVPYTENSTPSIIRWLYSVVCSQVAVVSAFFGLLNLLLLIAKRNTS